MVNWPVDRVITPSLAADLQRVAWLTVSSDLRTGVPEPTTLLGLASMAIVAIRRARR